MGEQTAAERYWANHRRGVLQADACTRLGVSPSQILDYYCNMMFEVTFGAWALQQVNTTARYPSNPYTIDSTHPRGFIMSKTSGVNNYGWITPFGNPSAPQVATIILTGSKSWYVAGRWSYQQATALPPPTTLRAGIVFNNAFGAAAPLMTIGLDGSDSSTKFTCKGDSGGSTPRSTISIDKDVMHDHKAWRTTTPNTFYMVDSETPVSGNSFPSASAAVAIGLFDSAANAVVGMTWQEFYVAVVHAET